MRSELSSQPGTDPSEVAGGLGERLRELRVAGGLTQTQLAGGRFSKEYVSQIERGKTRPTGETIAWLADRLGVDPAFLASGMSAGERTRLEAALVRAEALTEAHSYEDAVAEFDKVRSAVRATGTPELERPLDVLASGLVITLVPPAA